MINSIKASLNNEVVIDNNEGNISCIFTDGFKLDEINFSATIKNKKDLAELRTFLRVCVSNIK